MNSKVNLLLAAVLITLAAPLYAEENYEGRFADQFEVDDFGDEIEPLVETALTPDTQFYAGPLRSTEEDEIIVVSKDNVQQLIKTLMLAYTHSKDPTMTQLFKSGGLGALKTSFKYLNKEQLGEAILETAQNYIRELNLEEEEEKMLGEYAEEFLAKHKFKVVVPESFILHEKQMMEFLDMKKKSKKKGRSMGGFEDEESLELHSVLPYTGRQFSTSIIPGIDLTWLALLGGMMAIPYYFMSDDSSDSQTLTARKDEVAPPPFSLAPPSFAQGAAQNEVNTRKHPKRQRRPGNLQQGGQKRHRKLPQGAEQQTQQGKRKRNRPNQIHQEFKQQNLHIPPHLNSKVAVLPPIHAGVQPHGLHLFQIQGPVPQVLHHPPQFRGPINQQQGAPINFQQSIGAPPQIFAPPPIYQQVPGVVHSIAEQQSQESVLVPQFQQPPPKQFSGEVGNINDRKQINEHRGHHAPKPNSILQAQDKNQPKHQGLKLAPPPLPNQFQNNFRQNYVSSSPLLPGTNQMIEGGVLNLNSRAPFLPTHFQNGSAAIEQPHQNINFQQRPNVPIQKVQIQGQPPQGVRFRQSVIPGQQQIRPFVRNPVQPLPFGRQPIPGVRGVPQGPTQLSDPLLPPPPPVDQIGSGEQRDTFGTVRPNRESNSHFRVSHTDSKYNTAIDKIISKEKEAPVDDTIDEPVADESIASPTIVFARPQNNIPQANTNKNNEHVGFRYSAQVHLQPDESIKFKENPSVNFNRPSRPVYQHTKYSHEKKPVSPFHNDDGGFVPIYGPPTASHGILSETVSPMPKVAKPKDFLDKLLSENSEKKKSTVEITYGQPFSVSDETGSYPPNKPEIFSASRPATTTPSSTTQGSSIFVHLPTEQSTTSQTNPRFRVVTSTSVVTSRPVPLDQEFTFNFGEKFNDEKLKLKNSEPNVHPRIDQILGDEITEHRFESVPIEHHEISSSSLVNTEHKDSINDEEYRTDFRYQTSKPEVHYEDYVDEATEPIVHANDDEVLKQNSGGFVNNDEDEDSNAVQRLLMTAQEGSESIISGKDDDKRSLDNIPIYSLDPFYGPRLSRIDAIFFQLKLDSEGCRQQVVCNMYKNPDGYAPLSDFLSRQLTVTLEELKKPQVKDERILRFFRYLHAATIGQDGGDCQYEYPECSQDTTRLYNKPTLDYYHKVTDLIDRSTF